MLIIGVLSKQLFGAKYKRIGKSLTVCLTLFLAIYMTEMKAAIAPRILYLTAAAFSAGIMWQAINSGQNADTFMGLFMLPFGNRCMTFSVVMAFTAYSLITKTFFVLALFFAVHKWRSIQIIMSLLCACNGCFMAASVYTMTKRKKLLPIVLLWCGTVLLSIFFVQKIVFFALIMLASLFLSILQLLTVDAYVFYRPASAKLLVRHTQGYGSIFLYLLRYLITNKNYLVNTAGLCVIAVLLPSIFGQFEGLNIMSLGFAVLCLNTPICILLSCDRDLEQAVRALPGQASRFCTRYCLFIFLINMTVNSVYLLSSQIRHGCVGGMEVITALIIALQSAVLSVLLEWRWPIRSRTIESDLLHHPRKYSVPLIMLLIAVLISIWPLGIWIWLYIILTEILGLTLIVRRI